MTALGEKFKRSCLLGGACDFFHCVRMGYLASKGTKKKKSVVYIVLALVLNASFGVYHSSV